MLSMDMIVDIMDLITFFRHRDFILLLTVSQLELLDRVSC